jgi:flagellar hook assembly protein FlgD/flagellar motor protein MotB
MADLSNPAASALLQRTTLDVNYAALIGLGSEKGWGHSVNLGLAIPKPYGVWTGYLGILSSPFTSALPIGTMLTGRIGMAKDLYPNLLLGMALETQLGSNNGTDWGLGADIGVIGLLGDLGFMKGFTWGVSFRNLGKAFDSPGAIGIRGTPASSYESPFTPQIGIAADLIRSQDSGIRVSANADLWLPSLQNAVFATGLKLGYKDKAFLRLGWDINVYEALQHVDQGLIPSVGIGANFAIDRKGSDSLLSKAGFNRSELRPSIAASKLNGGVWAFGAGVNVPIGVLDRTPPLITIDYPKTEYDAYYFSPNNDGVLDTVTLPLTITDQRYVLGFSLKVFNEAGDIIKAIDNKESRPENQDLKGLIGRLLYVKKGVDVPLELVWNGLSDQGSAAPDGRYYISVEALDDNGNVALTERWPVVVDTVHPSVTAQGPSGGDAQIFSPDGDGNKDVFVITQTGSIEDAWKAEVLDAGASVLRTWMTKAAAPSEQVWDGKNDGGQIVPDGVYAYHISATDRAGNAGSSKVENIIVNTQQPPVSVSIDQAAFSPNGDGVKDILSLSPNVPVRSGMSTWKLTVLDSSDAERWSVSGTGADSLASRYQFNGKDGSGAVLKEGSYRTRLSVTYVNGHKPIAFSPTFIIDTSAPKASVAIDRAAFNPLAETNTVITVKQTGSEEDRWTGEILDKAAKAVKTWSFIGVPDASISWDGSDDAGKVVPDGSYTYRLSAMDKAGNAGEAVSSALLVDTGKKAVRLALDKRAFSPNADGVEDSLTLLPESQAATSILSWSLSIINASELKVRGFSGTGALPAKLVWDGKNDSGSIAADGNYRALLDVKFVTSETESARSVEMTLDTVAPSIRLSASDTLFSPDGDGRKDVVRFNQESVPGDTWEGRIIDAAAKTVRSWTWKDQASDFQWDGSDTQGNKVSDGTYRYVVTSVDAAGNKAEQSLDRIVVDKRQTQVFVTASATGFSPDGNGAFDDIAFGLVVKLREGIDSWSLAMVDQTGVARKTFSGKAATLPSKQSWDGKSDAGTIVQSTYQAVFTVDYQKGDRAESRSAAFTLDIDGPKVALTIAPKYFSPDNDGVDDELKISLAVADASDIDAWRFEIIEVAVSESASAKRAERVFFTWSGRGKPAERLVWDGRSQKGELVEAATDYPYRLTIVDALGNTTVSEGLIAVDVLVIRDGDRLKIKVPSIVFRANFADFVDLSEEKLERNAMVLKRIAEILNRFKDYKIRVEGHANSVAKMTGASQAAATKEETSELLPLSENRAALVMQKLIEYGVDPRRLSVRGLGSSEPVVAFTDGENRWKNRRVEFILIKD